MKCTKHYKVKEKLGSGASATVSAVCFTKIDGKERDCTSYALKQLKRELADELERELYFLNKLKQRTGTGISPQVREKWCCEDHCYQVVERFDCDFDLQATQQFKAWPPSTALTQLFPQLKTRSLGLVIFHWQLEQLKHIVQTLSEHGIIHGDAKLTNFLYRKQTDTIVAADFGLSGDFQTYEPIFGWTHVALGLPKRFPRTSPAKRSIFLRYWNLWDLEQYMLHDVVAFIVRPSSSFFIFNGFGTLLIPQTVRRFFEGLSPTYHSRIQNSPAAMIRSRLLLRTGDSRY